MPPALASAPPRHQLGAVHRTASGKWRWTALTPHVSVVSCVLSVCLHVLTTSPNSDRQTNDVFLILSSLLLRNTDQGVETCVRVSPESRPSGSDDKERRAVVRLHRHRRQHGCTCPQLSTFFEGADQGVHDVCASFIHDNA